MTQPITFTSRTPRFALPNLFAAQAQKEFFVNEALARIDMLLHIAVEGVSDTPPTAPADGESWIVSATPTGDWTSHAGEIASWQSGNWVFASPRIGMAAFDKSAGKGLRYDNGWQSANQVPAPSGGTTIDTEARTAIVALIEALVAGGILHAS